MPRKADTIPHPVSNRPDTGLMGNDNILLSLEPSNTILEWNSGPCVPMTTFSISSATKAGSILYLSAIIIIPVYTQIHFDLKDVLIAQYRNKTT